MAGIFVQLLCHSMESIRAFGARFLVSTDWDPPHDSFGAAPAIYGTLVSTAMAMVLAVPFAIVTALFLVELAPPILAKIVGACVELLAAIPSIIYGMWGLFVFGPFLAKHVQPAVQHTVLGRLPLFQGAPMGFGMLTAGVILAIMILPFICAVTRDAFAMVPAVVKESAYGMGSTTWEVMGKVTLRYCINGVIGATFLGLGRAIGETMAVTFVIGNCPRISRSLFDPGTSITATLANEFTEADRGLYLSSLIELGLILFVLTFVIQIVAHWWIARATRATGRAG